MKDSKLILDQVAQKIGQSQNNLATEAGHPKQAPTATNKEQLIDAINQSFELLRLNYQHLYFSAYSEVDALNSAKRLWMDSLSPFPATVILQAVHQLIKESDYLPTISRIIRLCINIGSTHSLPNAHSAYIEACNAPSPKKNANWSHPAVYYAGLKTDWFFIANNIEKHVFPIFKSNYEALCQRVINGEVLSEVTPLALPSANSVPLSKEENIQKMQAMREQLGI
jgi:hypothetical protein